jgi:enterochelin esterase family protein
MNVTLRIPEWATHLLSDLTDMERNPQPVDVGKVSTVSFELPDDAYFEYAFKDAAGHIRADPAGELRGDNPWLPEVSAIFGPAYQPDAYAVADERLATGKTQRFRLKSEHLNQTRRLITYSPTGYKNASLPCVFVQDGVAFYRIGKLHAVMERLLADGLMRPAHLVFIEPYDRTSEYRFNSSYQAFVLEELLPFIVGELPCTGERVALGASLGGLVSFCLAWGNPQVFQMVVTHSGAFLGTPANPDVFDKGASWLLEQVRREEAESLRWYGDVGTFEWLREVNQKIAQVLSEKGYEHRFAERHAGHNWVNWRNGFQAALSFALPPR